MAQWITSDTLKEALTTFRERGDERWALKSEIPTDEHMMQLATQVVGDISSLTPEELDEVIESL